MTAITNQNAHQKCQKANADTRIVGPDSKWAPYYWFFKLKDGYLAYRRISFEREAYANENSMNYLKERKFWNFRKYL